MGLIDFLNSKRFADNITKPASVSLQTSYDNKPKEINSSGFRPVSFDQYIGQENAKNILKRYIEATKKRNMVFPHTLIYGKPGTGKTTLARIISNNLNVAFNESTAQKTINISETIRILEKNQGGILFFDEVHSFGRGSVEAIYTVMEDFKYGLQSIPKFTLIGATTELGEILKTRKPFYDRFKIIIELEDYSISDLNIIGKQYKEKVFPNDILEENKILELAKNSRNTPRHLIRLLDSTIYFDGEVNEVLKVFGILKDGYTIKDYKLLEVLKLQEKGVGLQAISIYLDTPQETYLYEIEPLLLKNGMITRTSRGRTITENGKNLYKELDKIQKKRR